MPAALINGVEGIAGECGGGIRGTCHTSLDVDIGECRFGLGGLTDRLFQSPFDNTAAVESRGSFNRH